MAADAAASIRTGPHEPWRIALGELDAKLGVEIVAQSVDGVIATMPVAGNTQSLGRLHGGASAALAEADPGLQGQHRRPEPADRGLAHRRPLRR